MEKKVISSNLSRLIICINSIENVTPRGFVGCPTTGWGTAFQGLFSMLSKMEDYFDAYQFPQSTCQKRSFHNDERKQSANIKEGVSDMSDDKKTFPEKGEKATFIVHVQFRRNVSWQGVIRWVEQNKEQRFRSTLELIKLMDDAIGEDAEVEFCRWDEEERTEA